MGINDWGWEELILLEVCVFQVDGKTLCLLCTIKYKKDQFKKRNGTGHSRAGSGGHSATKRSWSLQDSELKTKPVESESG